MIRRFSKGEGKGSLVWQNCKQGIINGLRGNDWVFLKSITMIHVLWWADSQGIGQLQPRDAHRHRVGGSMKGLKMVNQPLSLRWFTYKLVLWPFGLRKASWSVERSSWGLSWHTQCLGIHCNGCLKNRLSWAFGRPTMTLEGILVGTSLETSRWYAHWSMALLLMRLVERLPRKAHGTVLFTCLKYHDSLWNSEGLSPRPGVFHHGSWSSQTKNS